MRDLNEDLDDDVTDDQPEPPAAADEAEPYGTVLTFTVPFDLIDLFDKACDVFGLSRRGGLDKAMKGFIAASKRRAQQAAKEIEGPGGFKTTDWNRG
jgi:hypothetical protein